jgi:hypothetical protein
MKRPLFRRRGATIMKRLTPLLAATLAMVLSVGVAYAKPKGATPPKDPNAKKERAAVVGTVKKIEAGNITVQTHGKNAGEIVVATDTKTQYEIDGAAVAIEKIKPGMQVVITPPTGTAQKVIVADPGKAKDKKKDKAKKDASATPAPKP